MAKLPQAVKDAVRAFGVLSIEQKNLFFATLFDEFEDEMNLANVVELSTSNSVIEEFNEQVEQIEHLEHLEQMVDNLNRRLAAFESGKRVGPKSERNRRICELRKKGKTFPEIGKILGIRTQTASAAYHRNKDLFL